jgi:hypothetical protein
MDQGESFPAGIPHPSPSPPGNPGWEKLGAGKNFFLLDFSIIFLYDPILQRSPGIPKLRGEHGVGGS